jgi:hypothetical protein
MLSDGERREEESEKRGGVRPRQYNFSTPGADYVRPGPLSYPPYYA